MGLRSFLRGENILTSTSASRSLPPAENELLLLSCCC